MTQDLCISPALESIIAPGTDADIIRQYASLASRAQDARFGLLEEDVIVIDTETTGLDFRECELIEVAAARLRGNEIVDTFDMFVKPESPIPPEIVSITGIDNDMVADAHDAAFVCSEFARFAEDAPLIAHNAVFDRHFLTKGNGGVAFENTWVDSLELSRIVMPCLTSHKLHDLSRAFDLHHSTHRAIDDVRATCGLWRIILTAASDLPMGLLNALADMYAGVAWSYRPIFAQLAAMYPNSSFSLLDERSQRCSRVVLDSRPDAMELEEQGPLKFPSPDEIKEAFSPDGVVGKMYEGYELRQEQVDMACEVARAFKSSENLAIEAGTGVGKSMAYLLPAAYIARANNITIGVATKSNALADQLIGTELPLLSKALDNGLSYTSLKGYDNYPCLRKVARLVRTGLSASYTQAEGDAAMEGSDQEKEEARKRGLPEPSEDLLNAIAAICAYASQSVQGDINCLGIRWGKLQRTDFTSVSSECQKNRCPFFPNKCFLHLARRRAAACDVVVTNHSLLFRQVASDIEVLPPIRYWVVDEAHAAESEARRQWALVVNTREMASRFEIVGGSSSGAIGNMLKAVQAHPAATLMMGLLTKISSECARASIASGLFAEDLKAFCRKNSRRRSGTYDTDTIWVDKTLRASEEYSRVIESGSRLRDILAKACTIGADAVKAMSEQAESDSDMLGRIAELTRALGGLAEIRDALDVNVTGKDESFVYSVIASQRTGFETYELAAEPIDIGARLAREWYPEIKSVVYSSATIAVADGFDHFGKAVGLKLGKDSADRSRRLPSGYDFESNMHIVVAEGLPDPTKQKDAYIERLAPLLIDAHLAMGGSVLTLFTNRSEMDQVYKVVQPELAKHGLELSAQLRGGNVRRLRDHFVAEQTSSLFALKSFWEGFDAKGDTLRCVIIPRLPFTPPTDPLSQERREREGKDAWRNHDLPEAVIAFKQAIGRLIRSSTDKGCLILADPRLTTMWYGRIFLASLPKKEYEKVSYDQVGQAVANVASQMFGA